MRHSHSLPVHNVSTARVTIIPLPVSVRVMVSDERMMLPLRPVICYFTLITFQLDTIQMICSCLVMFASDAQRWLLQISGIKTHSPLNWSKPAVVRVPLCSRSGAPPSAFNPDDLALARTRIHIYNHNRACTDAQSPALLHGSSNHSWEISYA